MDLGTTENLPVTVQIPGYRLRRQIGSDSIGLWLDAEQVRLKRRVTLKVLRPQFEQHPAARKEFLAEMDRLAGLDHPNLLRVLDTVREGTLVLITELTAGKTLGELLEPKRPLGEAPSVRYARCIARAAEYLDGKGFAHKNLTPALVQVLDEERCRLVTFRYVIPKEEQAALKGKLAQDAQYVAPEQIAGDAPIGARTPTYQIASLLFHMLAGRPPHGPGAPAELARAHLREEFPSLKRFQPFLSRGFYGLLAACTQRDPGARPSLAELGAALDKLAAGEDPGIAGPVARPVAPRRRRKR
ncbi:MAG: serine/threonine protein kinase [Planctomycetota bacterium]